MKTRTRVVAWFYILLQLPAMLVVTLFALAGSSLITVPHFFRNTGIESFIMGKIAGVALLLIAVIEGLVILLHVLPWMRLLKKKAWAWWMLTVIYLGGAAFWVTGMLVLTLHQHVKPKPAFGDMLPFLIAFGPTLLILLTDRPSMWKKARKSPTRRRRKRSTSRTRSRSRRTS